MRTIAPLCLALAAGLALAGEPQPFEFKPVSEDSLGLWEGQDPVLVYNHGMISRKGVPDRYDRACYIHPLYGLDGEVLTDDFPRDHRHHRGVFWAWPHIRARGQEANSWIPSGIQDRHERWVRREVDGGRAVLEVQNGWYMGDQKVMDERVRITVHPAAEDARAIDLEFTWTPVGQAVTLRGAGGKSYGGLTVRFNTRPREKDRIPTSKVTITVPRGVTEKDLPDTRLKWADFTAPFPGAPGPSGVAVFVAPDHPDYPPTWLTRHYGCLCVGWPGVKGKTLPPGEPVRCRYRLWVHRGQPSLDELRAAYQAYAETE
ncbi:MAG: DUF6807 family protein [Candidatus Brocadiia bacterium]